MQRVSNVKIMANKDLAFHYADPVDKNAAQVSQMQKTSVMTGTRNSDGGGFKLSELGQDSVESNNQKRFSMSNQQRQSFSNERQ